MTKELDRRFRHVGRIKRSWGTQHKPTIRLMEAMMSGLFERGRLDILRGIQSGQYTPLQVYDAYRTNELERLPTAATLAPLKESMEKWIAKKECAESHRRSLGQSLRHLLRHSTIQTSVASLPVLLSGLRERSLRERHPRSFNLARAAAQAFVKTTMGRNSQLWNDVSNVEVLKVTPQRRKHPLTPDEVCKIASELHPNFGDMVWTMACTGMGPGEYWGRWQLKADRIHIEGTKRAGRVRDVPIAFRVVGPAVEYAAFRRYLREASEGQVTPYDLRRTYATWLEAAAIPRTRRRAYMGHGARDITDLYEAYEVNAYLAEDGRKLRAYVFGATESTGLKLVEK